MRYLLAISEGSAPRFPAFRLLALGAMVLGVLTFGVLILEPLALGLMIFRAALLGGLTRSNPLQRPVAVTVNLGPVAVFAGDDVFRLRGDPV
jgi:hypothetical protein